MLIDSLDGIERTPPFNLAIWGAGKCFDVELNALTESFGKIQLVDIRSEDLAYAVKNLSGTQQKSMERLGGVDLSGVSLMLERYSKKRPDRRKLAPIIERAINFVGPETDPVDVLVSNSMLSQLMDHVVERVGTQNSQFQEFMLAIRNRHLDLLIENTRPGGIAFLVTDVVSSKTLPELAGQVKNLKAVLNIAIAQTNIFHGTNPEAILQYLRERSPHRKRMVNVDASDPWIWNGPDNLFRAVVAIRICLAQ